MKDYSRTYYSIEDVLKIIGKRLSGLQINKIESAYEFADKALESILKFNTPVFFHSTRVCYTMIEEFKIYNPELIISSLLSDIHKSNEQISEHIIDLNFGPYVTFITELMSEQDEYGLIQPDKFFKEFDNASVNINDFLTVWLIKHLDYFRCIDYFVNPELTSYIFNFGNIINSVEKIADSPKIDEIILKIKKERNKILC